MSILAIIVGIPFALAMPPLFVFALSLLGRISSVIAFGWKRGISRCKGDLWYSAGMGMLLFCPMGGVFSCCAMEVHPFWICMVVIPLFLLLILRIRTPFADITIGNPATYTNASWLKKTGYWDMAEDFAREVSATWSTRLMNNKSQILPTVVLGEKMFAIALRQHYLVVVPYKCIMWMYKVNYTMHLKGGLQLQNTNRLHLSCSIGGFATPQPSDGDIIAIAQRVLDVSPKALIGTGEDQAQRFEQWHQGVYSTGLDSCLRIAIFFLGFFSLASIGAFIAMTVTEGLKIEALPFVVLMCCPCFVCALILYRRHRKRKARRMEIHRKWLKGEL